MNSEFTSQDYIFMSQAIKLASKGQFTVRSNPLVGCVLVKNNQVIGKGWHQYAGGPHAEINAIKSAVVMLKIALHILLWRLVIMLAKPMLVVMR